MAGRYLIIAGRQPSIGTAGSSWAKHDLQPVITGPDLQLFVNSAQPWAHSPEKSAGIVGNLHARLSPAAERSPSRPQLDRDFDETQLLSSFWGDYVSFRYDGPKLKVMRDPSGMLPCFFIVAEGAIYLASDVSLLVLALGKAPAIDWGQLARLLYVNDLPEERTALAGVRDLLPGHVLEFAGDRAEARPIWSPWNHVDHGDGPTPRHLEQCVRQCVTTIAAPFKSVLIGVSGGLDSSIVTACLTRERSALHPITISTDDAHGDESAFAQVLCDHFGLPLIREAYRLTSVDINRSSIAHLPRPGGRAQLQAYDSAVLAAAGQTGAAAFMSGVGGDNVFYSTHSARPLVDLFLDKGPGLHIITTLQDIRRVTGCSTGEAIRQALAVPRADETCKYSWHVDTRFLHAERLSALSQTQPSHPWLVGPPSSRPGRAAHIAMILRAQHYMDAQDREWSLPFLQPLLAQPIVEMCLGIPSWRVIAGGRDRAVARQAFAASLPAAINDRRVKGGPDGFAHHIIRSNLPAIREKLLNGVLAARQVLDRPALDIALREETLTRGTDYVRILLLLDTEAWARHWIARRESASPFATD